MLLYGSMHRLVANAFKAILNERKSGSDLHWCLNTCFPSTHNSLTTIDALCRNPLIVHRISEHVDFFQSVLINFRVFNSFRLCKTQWARNQQ